MRKRVFLFLFLSASSLNIFSQVPQGFNYQAVARDASGNILANTSLQAMMYVQSLSDGGTIFWKELHSSITTNDFGLFTLVVGTGTRQTESTVATFDLIDWGVTPKFLKTEIYYSGSWKEMGTSQLLTVPYAMVAEDLAGSVKKLSVEGETSGLEEALFEVKNRDGQTVFAVYNEGVRIYVSDGAKAVKGGFAVGGFGTDKAESQKYFMVTKDSTRVYVDENPLTKGKKTGFAVGGYDLTKGSVQNYLDVSADSVRVYVDTDPSTKKVKGGFAVGGYDMTKGMDQEYLRVTADSVKVSKSLLIPRLSTYERDHLPFIPGEALIIFNTTEGCMQIFKNNVWSNIWCFNCAPAFLIQPVDNIICSGNNVNFFISATGTNLNYQWQQSTNGGTTWNNLSNGGTNPVVSGATGYSLILTNVPVGYDNYKYRCIVVGPCLPNVTSNSVTLNVGSTPPVFSLQPTNKVLSTGCAASFSVASPGYGVLYKWQQSSDGGTTWNNISNGGTSPVYAGALTATLSLTNVPWSYNGYKYRCIASNLCGADATSNPATLTITPVSILTQPSNQQLTTGCTASFSITTPAGYVISYQWQASADGGGTWGSISNGGTSPVYSGVTTATLSLSNVPLAYNNYKYRCVVSSLCGPNETSSAATLTIVPSSILTQPSNQILSDNCTASFGITTPAGYVIIYQWQVSSDGGSSWGNITNGGTSPVYSGVSTTTLSLSNVPITYNNFQYRCIVSSVCGPNETSNAATLTLITIPAITAQPHNEMVYPGYNITFSITTSGSGYSYQWQESTNGGGTFSNLVDNGSTPGYSGTNTPNFSLSQIPVTYNNFQYRCVVSHTCRPGAISDAAILSVPTPSPVSDIDGNSYNTVGVGSQLWMAENLKTTKYRNGDLIGTTTPPTLDISSEDTPKYQWAYDGNESNVNIYGRLYTWFAVTDNRNVCPTGWHLPTNEEWVILNNYLGGDYGGAGGKLKESGTTHWNEPNTGATNEIGFTALPGGARFSGYFYAIGDYGWWSTATEGSTTEVTSRMMTFDSDSNGWINRKKTWGLSVRCVKD